MCLEDGVKVFVPAAQPGDDMPPDSPYMVVWGTQEVRRCVFRLKWAVDTGKCVDSSPLVVQQEGTPTTVYCGSHSGVFVAIALHTGEVRWRQRLSDRTESSPCASICLEFVLVGEVHLCSESIVG